MQVYIPGNTTSLFIPVLFIYWWIKDFHPQYCSTLKTCSGFPLSPPKKQQPSTACFIVACNSYFIYSTLTHLLSIYPLCLWVISFPTCNCFTREICEFNRLRVTYPTVEWGVCCDPQEAEVGRARLAALALIKDDYWNCSLPVCYRPGELYNWYDSKSRENLLCFSKPLGSTNGPLKYDITSGLYSKQLSMVRKQNQWLHYDKMSRYKKLCGPPFSVTLL